MTYLVRTNAGYNGLADTGDCLQTIGNAAGLPSIGDAWTFGNDNDEWVICHPDRQIRLSQYKPLKDGAGWSFYEVDVLFSSRPLSRCMTTDNTNPLLEPQKVSGGMVKGKIEATEDRNGNLFKSSSHEMYRGPQAEFDSSHPTVHIEQNVSTLQLALCSGLMDHVNDDTLWGLDARTIKLSNFSWTEKWYGVCTYYYTRVFDFEVKNNPNDSWDREIVDEGTRALNGRWADEDDDECTEDSRWITVDVCGNAPDPTNPQDFCRYKDRWGENQRVLLNGAGKPAHATTTIVISPGTGETGTGNTGEIAKTNYEYYPEGDFTQLGIPTSIDFGTAT
jgi:hypothetical protein